MPTSSPATVRSPDGADGLEPPPVGPDAEPETLPSERFEPRPVRRKGEVDLSDLEDVTQPKRSRSLLWALVFLLLSGLLLIGVAVLRPDAVDRFMGREAPEEIDYDAQVQALREKLRDGVGLYNSGQYEKGLSAFEEALALDPQNKYARLFVIKIKRILEDLQNVADIPLNGVPRLKVTLVELAQLDLDPQEGFVLSRVNGEWDVDSITKICPMGEQEVLIIFKRLFDQGLIEFDEPR